MRNLWNAKKEERCVSVADIVEVLTDSENPDNDWDIPKTVWRKKKVN